MFLVTLGVNPALQGKPNLGHAAQSTRLKRLASGGNLPHQIALGARRPSCPGRQNRARLFEPKAGFLNPARRAPDAPFAEKPEAQQAYNCK
jgi:hypothetical protein